MLVSFVGADSEEPGKEMLVIGINLKQVGGYVSKDAYDGQRKECVEASG